MKLHRIGSGKDEILVSIGQFAVMDIPMTEPNERGVFVKHVVVNIPMPAGQGLGIGVARDRYGLYHYSCSYFTQTEGGGFYPSRTWNAYRNKEDVFVDALRYFQRHYGTRHTERYVSEAKREFFRSSHRQMELF